MKAKPYKSPLGFYFTAEEELMYRRAIEEAVRFFETYGKGIGTKVEAHPTAPTPEIPHRKLAYHEEPVGSIQIMEHKAAEEEKKAAEEETEWMDTLQLAKELALSRESIYVIAKSACLEYRTVPIRGGVKKLYRISDMRMAADRHNKREPLGELTPREYLKGRYMSVAQLAEALGLDPIAKRRILVHFSQHRFGFWICPEMFGRLRLYEYDEVMNSTYIQSLIKRYKTK